MSPIRLNINYSGKRYVVEIDDFDYSITGVWVRHKNLLTPIEPADVGGDFEDMLETLCERLGQP